MRQSIRFLLAAMLCSSGVLAQTKQTHHEGQVWVAYNNQTRLSDRWGIWFDGHLRTKQDLFTNFSTSILRPGIIYYINDGLKLVAGYAYVVHFPADGHSDISRPEHRPWQQVQWHNKYRKLRTMQWLRLEERFRRKILNSSELAEGYDFNFRVRHNFLLQWPLGKRDVQPKSLSLVANNELHINFGKQIVNNYFDQNRFFLGFSYQVSATDNVQFGYMNVFQQLPAGNQYRSLHVPRVYYFQNLDFRKKKS